MIDIVRSCVGEEPSKRTLQAAEKDHPRFMNALLQTYERMGGPTVARKAPDEFVPAWFLNVSYNAPFSMMGKVLSPMPIGDADLRFVVRGMLYAHRVAVQNELEMLLKERDNPYLFGPHVASCLRRIVTYAPLEEHGLLTYVRPSTSTTGPWPNLVMKDLVDSFLTDVLVPKGIVRPDFRLGQDEVDDRLFRNFAERHLMSTLPMLRELLVAINQSQQSVDLFVPNDDISLESLQWLTKLDGFQILKPTLSEAHGREQATLNGVLSLPELDPAALREMDVSHLLRIRGHDVFEAWRGALHSSLHDMAIALAIEGQPAFDAFYGNMMNVQQEVLDNARKLKPFRGGTGELRRAGISVMAGTAAIAGPDKALIGTISSAAGALSPSLFDLARQWMSRGDAIDATKLHFRVVARG